MAANIYQLKITLIGYKPSIWRRILVGRNILLQDLHKVLQTTMGWTNSHLHQFIDGRKFYSEPSDWDDDTLDYSSIKLGQLLKSEKSKLLYEYDFGDGWRHELLLEKILEEEKGRFYPVCIDGKNACPLEDCGGIWGYAELLKTLSNPKSDKYEEMLDWAGGPIDPTEFDLEEINLGLNSNNFGVYSFFD